MSVEADSGISDETDTDDPDVLENNVNGVFLLGQAGFEGGKSEVHDEDHGRGNDRPKHRGGEEIERV